MDSIIILSSSLISIRTFLCCRFTPLVDGGRSLLLWIGCGLFTSLSLPASWPQPQLQLILSQAKTALLEWVYWQRFVIVVRKIFRSLRPSFESWITLLNFFFGLFTCFSLERFMRDIRDIEEQPFRIYHLDLDFSYGFVNRERLKKKETDPFFEWKSRLFDSFFYPWPH